MIDIDFGAIESGNPTAVQPGFIERQAGSVSAGDVVFDITYSDGALLKFYLSGFNNGPYGALLSDGIVLIDPFTATNNNGASLADFEVSGLTPEVLYEVEFYKPADRLFRDEVEGLLDGSPHEVGTEFYDEESMTIQIEPDAAGVISGRVYQDTNTPTYWSGISVRVAVPEPGACLMAGLAFTAMATRRR